MSEWAEYAAREFEKPRRPAWRKIARPEQLAPPGEWLVWAFVAGRGAGKTRSAAEWTDERAKENPGCRIALVGRTPADARDVMIEGESGILAVAGDDRPLYQPSKRRLTWPNGSTAYTYSAEVPSQLRGPQHHFAWADEAASWTDARKGDVLDTAWNNLLLGLRLGASPRCAVTTTPKPNALMKTLLGRETTVVTRGSTYDNLANLAPSFRDEVLAAYEGTRIGRQELMGELLEDFEGALWTWEMLDACRVAECPPLVSVVVAVDPAVTSEEGSDETGIVVAGKGDDGKGYVLADLSVKASPAEVARRVAGAYSDWSGSWVVAETNQGGDYIGTMIRSVDPGIAYKQVRARRNKYLRAEPVAALYEQGRVRHAAQFVKLEEQMATYVPGAADSPDRLDALVYAITALKIEGAGMTWMDVYAPERDEQGNVKRGDDEPPNPWAEAYGSKGG